MISILKTGQRSTGGCRHMCTYSICLSGQFGDDYMKMNCLLKRFVVLVSMHRFIILSIQGICVSAVKENQYNINIQYVRVLSIPEIVGFHSLENKSLTGEMFSPIL